MGEVFNISLDYEDFIANVVLQFYKKYNIPSDSKFQISADGLVQVGYIIMDILQNNIYLMKMKLQTTILMLYLLKILFLILSLTLCNQQLFGDQLI